jgi:hypothetical protein
MDPRPQTFSPPLIIPGMRSVPAIHQELLLVYAAAAALLGQREERAWE